MHNTEEDSADDDFERPHKSSRTVVQSSAHGGAAAAASGEASTYQSGYRGRNGKAVASMEDWFCGDAKLEWEAMCNAGRKVLGSKHECFFALLSLWERRRETRRKTRRKSPLPQSIMLETQSSNCREPCDQHGAQCQRWLWGNRGRCDKE